MPITLTTLNHWELSGCVETVTLLLTEQSSQQPPKSLS